MYNVQANTCLNGVVITNSANYETYSPPQFVFEACQWNIFRQLFNFQGCSEVSITDNLAYVAEPSAGLSGSYAPADFMYFAQVADLTYDGSMIEGVPGSTLATMINFDAGCSVCSVSNHNVFRSFGSVSDAVIKVAAGCSAIREDGTNFFFTQGGAPIFDMQAAVSGAGNVLQTRVAALGAQCDIAGNITYQNTLAANCDATGHLTVTLPSGLFTNVKSVVVSNGDLAACPGSVGVIYSTISATGFEVQFAGVSAVAEVRVNYIVYGD